MSADATLDALLGEVRACRACEAHLPHGVRPVVRASPTARILIAGQAPGARVHASGVPFDDPSGDRLRDWLGLDRDAFYDETRIAIVPQGFCFPGTDPRGGDYPPRPECAKLWHPRLIPMLGNIELFVCVGQYAHAWHLDDRRKRTVTETVRAWRDYLPTHIALPHPSWRNTGWIKKNPWFSEDVLPYLREAVARLL